MKKTKNNFPQSIRKYIRAEKSKIRKEILTSAEAKEGVKNLYKKVIRVKK